MTILITMIKPEAILCNYNNAQTHKIEKKIKIERANLYTLLTLNVLCNISMSESSLRGWKSNKMLYAKFY